MRPVLLATLRRLGIFAACALIHRKKLLILCYHGISCVDEHAYSPGLFMQNETFRNRLRLLKAAGFTPVSLDDAVQSLNRSSLPPNPVVITADDGYANSPGTLAAHCQAEGFPLTIYVRSDYVEVDAPIFVPTVHYLIWKSQQTTISSASIRGVDLPDATWRLDNHEKEQFVATLKQLSGTQPILSREAILREIAVALDVDFASVKRNRMFHLMDPREIESLAANATTIESHTHHHRFPTTEPEATNEIQLNRNALEPLTGRPLRHFCYPSGITDPSHLPRLKALGMHSATTLVNGLNDANTNPFLLRRKLDRDDMSQDEFIAEATGFFDLARKLRKTFKRKIN